MIVECTNIINELAKNEPPRPLHKERLTIGKRYHVLEVSFDNRASMCWYRIDCDDRRPWLILSTQFKIVCNKIPSNWVVSQYDGGITFSPETWILEGFWRRLAEEDAVARKIYEEEKQKMST